MRSNEGHEQESIIYCGMCGAAVHDDMVGYDPGSGKFYHPGDCALEANGRISEKREEKVPMNIGYITLAYAKLLHLGEEEGGVFDEELPCPWRRHDG